MVDRHHYMPTQEQKDELAAAWTELKAKAEAFRARRQAQAAAAAPILEMLSVVRASSPLDNPIIESNFGAL